MSRRLLAYTTVAVALSLSPGVFAASNSDPAALPAGTYVLDKSRASLCARVLHQGRSIHSIHFDRFDASFDYDPETPTAARVRVEVDARSLNTGWRTLDRRVPAGILAADRHPRITFEATELAGATDNRGVMTGNLTLAGVTKPVTLDVTWHGAGTGADGELRTGFSATTRIRRSEFGSTRYLATIGDEVELAIDVEFTKA